MKKLAQLVFGTALVGIIAVGCQETTESGNAEKASPEQSEQTEESTEKDGAVKTETTSVLNANIATDEDLKAIGLSPELIAQILKERPFITMNALDSLINPEEDKAALYKKIFVPFNINTTPEADFKMIPGVGERMAHEFDEYRPYTSIKQFRKEIGKYVDEEEVARYENYVFVPVELNTASEDDIKALPGVGERLAAEFVEYRPYTNMVQFRKEIGKYVEVKELDRLERFVYLKE